MSLWNIKTELTKWADSYGHSRDTREAWKLVIVGYSQLGPDDAIPDVSTATMTADKRVVLPGVTYEWVNIIDRRTV